MLGSADYFNDAVLGKINGTVALRQPGSSVKPFTYGVAMEAGYTPSTMLADIPTSIPNDGGDYVPENYDREYHGPVLLRTALACSYNIPCSARAPFHRSRSALSASSDPCGDHFI
jgi:penicillin-binding protein 1C